MGTRENKVETYLRDEIKKLNGDTRKWISPGRDGVPDQICFLPHSIFFVEVKTMDGKFQPGQEREHGRLRDLGAHVCTVWGHKGVDALVNDLRLFNRPVEECYGKS
jgi:hypothetical protein